MLQALKKLMPTEIRRQIRALALTGKHVFCPCCKGQFATFLPKGIVKRPNAECPRCLSLERHRLMQLYLEQKVDLLKPPQKKLLHVAPEPIFFKQFINNPLIDYVPLDKFTKGYKYPKETINGDITQLDFAEGSFDAIICSHVLEHIPDDALAMKELFRVLKPGGWAILQVPLDESREETYEDFSITDPDERQKHFGQFDHVRVYGRDYGDRLTAAGFKLTVDDFIYSFSQQDRFRLGLLMDEEIYLCHKSDN